MGILRRKNTTGLTAVTPLDEARELAAGALNTFVQARNDLADAVEILENEKQWANDYIANLQADIDAANADIARNVNVIGKLDDLVGIPAVEAEG